MALVNQVLEEEQVFSSLEEVFPSSDEVFPSPVITNALVIQVLEEKRTLACIP